MQRSHTNAQLVAGATALGARKVTVVTEDTVEEAGIAVDPPARIAIAAIVIRNPWAGAGYVEDLEAVREDVGARVGATLAELVTDAAGGAVETYGKAAIVGLEGEIEHASALIHTLRFGDPLRERVGGSALLPAVEKRAGAGQPFDIPLKNIHDAAARPYHQTVEARVADAPHPHEMLVALAVSTAPRPLARLRS